MGGECRFPPFLSLFLFLVVLGSQLWKFSQNVALFLFWSRGLSWGMVSLDDDCFAAVLKHTITMSIRVLQLWDN